ncbi:hypothetical protein [Pseudokineococcus sp. 1T1Z-3]|uniref:hypothetical protein n=1 Tax=Pseudokineococcus sp. 1T1Z-3 TaxID=3132745 RepID=UPI00309C1303
MGPPGVQRRQAAWALKAGVVIWAFNAFVQAVIFLTSEDSSTMWQVVRAVSCVLFIGLAVSSARTLRRQRPAQQTESDRPTG